MPLRAGSRLGQYEIATAVGAGGMGEVYRARDTRLHRDVAIKTLPPGFAADRDRLSRFEREAQSLAALNHPNIAQIYGVIDDPPALVMELVDGEDLSARIARGPIPMGEALALATQIAQALECAHERGIVHRDLKPANIRVSEAGIVKVLDFGLAKALVAESPGPGPGAIDGSPTFTSPAMTELGVILGTAAYMAPEQAKGRAVDRRADAWAFGGILFEMLTGRRAFPGEDVTDVIASIMRAEPEWTALPPATPAAVRRLLQRCLEKDRANRLDSMAVARFEIQDALAAPVAPAAAPSSRRSAMPVVATGIACALAAAGATWLAMRSTELVPPVRRVHVTPIPPDGLSLDTFIGDVDVSPDGNVIAYNGKRQGSAPEIFVRRLDQDRALALPGTAEGRAPAFSADGQWVSFQLAGDIRKVPVNGGAAEVVCTQCSGGYRGGAWLPDGSFVFSTSGGQSGLRLLRPDASAPEPLTQVDRAANERGHGYPRVLPGGRGILFVVEAVAGGGHVAVLDLRSKTTKVLARGGSNPQYAPSGHLLYAASGTLYAVPFDLERLETTGVATPVLDRVVTKSVGAASYAVAPGGTLVYVAGDPVDSTYSVTLGRRSGPPEHLPLPPGVYVMGRFSPDGRQAVFDSRTGGLDLHVWDFATQLSRRLTFVQTADQYPAWTPDGKQVVYSGSDAGTYGVFRKNADGTGTPERLTSHDALLFPTAFIPGGRTLIGHVSAGSASLPRGLYAIEMEGDHTPRLLDGTAKNPLNAHVAPDGKWIAYETAESSRSEIVVHPYPNISGGRWQVSTNGGSQPLFSARGDELFYRDAERRLLAVPVQFDPGFIHGSPTVVMENVFSPGPGRPYDVSPDGQRFILVHESRVEQTTGSPPQLNVILNWTEELKRLAPARK